jgi:hypothetical protein
MRHNLLAIIALGLFWSHDLQAQGHPQDFLGLSFAGNVAAFDSSSGAGITLGQSTRSGHNGMARIGDDLFTTEQVGVGATAQFFLNRVDDETGVATRSVALSRDLRALAPGGNSSLLAIANNSTNDELVSVNLFTGTITVIGLTGFSGIQGLTLARNTFYGWDINAGLLRIDHLTGQATDVNTSLGTAGATIQFLSTLSDGSIIGGQNSIYVIEPSAGFPRLRGSGAYNDLRGAEERFGVMFTFGQSCGGITQTISGVPRVGGSITTESSGHGTFDGVIVMLGFSANNFRGLPLPLSLETVLGLPGCFLYAGPEITLGLRADIRGRASLSIPIPAFADGLLLRLQHVNLNAPGGVVAFSNAAGGRVDL